MDAAQSDEDNGEGSMDFCIADTQYEPDAAKAKVGNAGVMDFAQTQVDDGRYSDDEEAGDDGRHFSSTQVDEDYYRRLMEDGNFLDEDKPAEEEKAIENERRDATAEPEAEKTVSPHKRQPDQGKHANDNDDDDESGTESMGDMDFCIADTQLPVAEAPSVLPAQAVDHDAAAAQLEESHLTVYDYLSLSAPASTGEAPHKLTPAVPLPLNTPIMFSATPADIALGHTTNSSAFTTARSGGVSGGVSGSVDGASTGVPGREAEEEEEPTQLDGSSLLGNSSGDTPEKILSGASHSSSGGGGHGGGGADERAAYHNGGESETHASGPFSAEKVLSNSRRSDAEDALSGAPTEKHTTVAPMPAATATAGPGRAETSSGFATEWLSAKPKAPVAKDRVAPPAYCSAVYIRAPLPQPTEGRQGSPVQAANASAVLLPATLPATTTASTSSAAPLEDRTLEELVLMQQQLQRIIAARAQQQQDLEQAAGAGTTGSADQPVAAAASSGPALQRQDTSYGMSQPAKEAISGLMKLKGDALAAADTTAAPVPTAEGPAAEGNNGRARWYTAGPTVPTAAVALTPGPTTIPVVAGAYAASPAFTSATATPSPAARKKFFRRKLAGTLAASPATPITTAPSASSATTSPAAPQKQAPPPSTEVRGAEGNDSDVPSPERERGVGSPHAGPTNTTTTRPSPSKVKFNLPGGTVAPGASSSSKATTAPTGGARSGQSKGGRNRRVIHDDESEDGAEVEEAEFDEAHTESHSAKRAKDPSSSSSANGGKGIGSTSAAERSAELSSATEDTEDTIRHGLPADLPLTFLTQVPGAFSELWHTLQGLGWTWKHGNGLVSYYYVRPKCSVKKGFLQGRDYFADEEGLWQFVNTVVSQCRSRMPAPAPKPVTLRAPATLSAPAATVASAPAAFAPAPHPRALANLYNSQSQSQSQSVLQLPDDPSMRSIRDIPWKWLWKLLKSKGWTWDYGPQHVNFYFAPGYTGKSKDAELNVHKFENEESVRRFIRKQRWPEFAGAALERQASTQPESQAPDAYLHDPSWQLASHRGKRPHVAPAKYDASAESGSESGAEGKAAVSKVSSGGTAPGVGAGGAPQGRGKGSAGNKRAKQDHVREQTVAYDQATQQQLSPPPPPQPATRRSPLKQPRAQQQTAAEQYPPAYPPGYQMAPGQGKGQGQKRPRDATPTAAAATGAVVDTAAKGGAIFAGNRYVVSGIPEKIRNQLVKDIKDRGGTVLLGAPADGNDSKDEVVSAAPHESAAGGAHRGSSSSSSSSSSSNSSSGAQRKGCVIVVSHPKEFRKPNYLMALATGVALVHLQWVRDSTERGQRQPLDPYLLPSGCSSLHGYNLFPLRTAPSEALIALPGRQPFAPSQDSVPAEPVLTNIKVLNFAGSGWDNVLLAAGATTVQNSSALVQALCSLSAPTGRAAGGGGAQGHGGRNPARMAVDYLLIDPLEYASAVATSGNSNNGGGTAGTPRFVTPTLPPAPGRNPQLTGSGAKSPAAKMTTAELTAVQRCLVAQQQHQQQASSLQRLAQYRNTASPAAPIVVTTDWLVHCLALGRVLDHSIVDIFTPPEQPQRKPYTYKADTVTGGGERYTKYDVVFYRRDGVNPNPNPSDRGARHSPSKASRAPPPTSALSIGRIEGFSRRDETSQLFARISPLVPKASLFPNQPARRSGSSDPLDAPALRHKELTGDPSLEVCMVEVERLGGKAVLLQQEDFMKVRRYAAQDDCVFYASREWVQSHPCLLRPGVGVDGEGYEEEDSAGGDDAAFMRRQASQDY